MERRSKLRIANLQTQVKKKLVKKKKRAPVNKDTVPEVHVEGLPEGMRSIKGTRFMDVRDCHICNGNPEEVPFDLPTMTGFRCKDCMEVLAWKKK